MDEIDIAKTFRLICYDLEVYSNRKWIVEEIFTSTYPKSYYFTTFKNSAICLLCHNKTFIFALCDSEKGGHGLLDTYYIDNGDFAADMDLVMKSHNMDYNFLKPDFLSLKFYNKAEFENLIL